MPEHAPVRDDHDAGDVTSDAAPRDTRRDLGGRDGAQPARPALAPLMRWAESHRVLVGMVLAVLALSIAVGSEFAAADPLTPRAILGRVASMAFWALIAAVAVLWALKRSRLVIDVCAGVALLCWLLVVLSSW